MLNKQSTSTKNIAANIETILYDEECIKQRVKELGSQITRDLAGKVSSENPLMVIGILKGVIVFLADLLREIDLPMELHFIDMESQSAGTRETGLQELDGRISAAVKGRYVLFVEDIVDAGLTLSFMTRLLWQSDPSCILVCTLFSKENNRMMDIELDYVGFELPPVYVVGYGLDHDEQYRNLPFVGVLKQHNR
ncbi:MAG: hypoxanthine phosphoribosyltransferase [Chloroflexota bacterium]